MADYDVEVVLKNIFDNSDAHWKPEDKIPLITKEIDIIKTDLISYLNNSDYNIEAILSEGKQIHAETNSLVKELETCKKEIEEQTMAEILKSIEKHDQITTELKRVDFALNIVVDVLTCGTHLKQFEQGREAESYSQAVEALYDLMNYIDMPVDGFKSIDLYTNTKQTANLLLDNMLHDLNTEWARLICWSTKPGTRKTTVTMTLKLDEIRPILDVVNALFISKNLKLKVTELSHFILKDLLIPIINNDCTVFAETDELMTVTINHKQNYKPPYDVVIANLRLLFHYLSNKLHVNFDEHNTLMQMIGDEIRVEFREILVKYCLEDTVPNNINELQSYGKITSEIADFQHFLFVVGFFPNEQFSILLYIENIDVLFANKSSQHFLETARLIMLKDLSATMSIGVETIPEDGKQRSDGVEAEALSILDKTIPKSLFYFPRCMISKTAQELLDLVYMMMEQAVQCSDVVCKKLYNTTRLVFELYDSVVPYHHENYLQTIPQYVALFHNNCMYLAHNLQTLGDKWLVLMEGRAMDYPIGFVDLVPRLRDLGLRHLTVHMQQQRKQILDNIRSSDLNCIAVRDVLSEDADGAVRQCLRQLHLLKNVWIGVFPNNVFTRLMATLVNMFAEELCHRVCSAEDISMEAGAQLADTLARVAHKAPHLFQTPSDVETHVKSWTKLQELIFVLGGSLKDIENHWKDGTGPLAVHFKTEELRNLIKALFQNTQNRANLLSKIK